jgi:two-component system chemotaxis response regulator CheB
MIRCLVADDSRTFRAILRTVLARAQGVEVVGEAADGDEAVKQVLHLRPDVVTMDVRMPGKDGLAAIAEIMDRAPTPVIVVSGEVGPERQEIAFQALALGAIEVLAKPRSDAGGFERDAEAIRQAVRAVAGLRLVTRHRRPPAAGGGQPGSAPRRAAPWTPPPAPSTARAPIAWPAPTGAPAVVIGVVASTGGPPVIASLLRGLPANLAAPVLVVQHIAAGFEAGFAHWLSAESGRKVKVVYDGAALERGSVWVAPEGRHLLPRGGLLHLGDGPPVRGFRPSGTVLFEALAEAYDARAAGLVLSGMGDDGADGLRSLRACGAPTAAQGPATSVVYGMPKVALERGGAAECVEAEDLAAWVARVAR